MTSPVQQSARARSWIAWLALALLVGVGHVVPALHFLFVAHHLCAEHGELVDAPGGRAANDRAANDRAEASREKVARVTEQSGSEHRVAEQGAAEKNAPAAIVASGGGAHSHEHCDAFAATRGSVALAPPPGEALWLPSPQVVRPLGAAREAHVDIELLCYAPKLAPPSGVSSSGVELNGAA